MYAPADFGPRRPVPDALPDRYAMEQAGFDMKEISTEPSSPDPGCRYVTFGSLAGIPGLAHSVFTRHGGVSRPPYDSLNVSWSNGDSPEAVRRNILRVRDCLGLGRLVSARQVHGETVRVVDEESLALGAEGPAGVVLPPADALVTNLRGIGLMIKIADCQAIFLVDPVKQVIANIHCGWRGSVKNLAVTVAGVLRERFGCRPEDILASVSPSLGPCCAEFRNYRDELPPALWEFQVRPQYFDFWAVTRRQLTGAGLAPENIELAGRCTVCESREFFSYRAEHTTGRMAAVIGWKHETREAPE
jgi:polyphenol oxidase